MRLILSIGWLESRDGPFLGLREMVENRVLPRHRGVRAEYHSYADDVVGALRRAGADRARQGEPLVLLGHSYGASALVRAARKAPEVTVDHMILLDPVPRWLWGQFQWGCYWLTANVKAATCLYNPWSLPKSSPIRGGIQRYRNIKVSPLHASIPGDQEVQGKVLAILDEEFGRRPAPPVTVKAEPIRVPPVVRAGA